MKKIQIGIMGSAADLKYSDEALKLVPVKKMTLEQSIDFIGDDELVEITPQNIRIRKKILDPTLRFRTSSKK